MKNPLLIIIPAYNEEKNIKLVLDSVGKEDIAKKADIVVINDGSTDNTAKVVKDYRLYNVGLISHKVHRGYAGALRTGYRYAAKNHYEYVIQMDADGQHDAGDIVKIYEGLNTTDENGKLPDIVLGSRFNEESGRYHMPFAMKLAVAVSCLAIRMSTGKTISDPTTGLQGFNRRTICYYARNFDCKYPDANIIIRMLLKGFCVKEVSVTMYERLSGRGMYTGIRPLEYAVYMTFAIIAEILKGRLFYVN